MSFTVGGVKINIGFLYVAVLCFFSLRSDTNLILATIIFSLLHECGHLLVMLWFDDKPKEIRFHAFGIEIKRSVGIHLSYLQESVVLLAGPCINFITAVIFGFLANRLQQEGLYLPCAVNLILAGFNLLPIFGTDGGQALSDYLKHRFSEKKARKISNVVMLTVLVCLYLGAILFSYYSSFPFSFLGVLFYLTLLTLSQLAASDRS